MCPRRAQTSLRCAAQRLKTVETRNASSHQEQSHSGRHPNHRNINWRLALPLRTPPADWRMNRARTWCNSLPMQPSGVNTVLVVLIASIPPLFADALGWPLCQTHDVMRGVRLHN
jgi:hypothetical protein